MEATPETGEKPKPEAQVEPKPAAADSSASVPSKSENDGKPEEATAPTGSVHLEARTVSAETVYFIGSQVVQTAAGQARETRAIFERREWSKVAAQQILVERELEIRASAMLRKHRLLVLAGEPELGKATLALAVARRAVDDSPPVEVLIHRDLDETIALSFENLAEELRNRVIVLKDGFAQQNKNLCGLGERLTREYLPELSAKLRAAKLFVVVTSDSHHVPAAWRALTEDLLCACEAPAAARLLEVLDSELAGFSKRDQFGKEFTLAFTPAERERIVSRVKTIPRLIRFRRDAFEGLARRRLNLDAALDGFEDLTVWFMKELRDREPASWCHALAACLLQADPLARTSSYRLVHSFAKELAGHLQANLPGWNRKRLSGFLESDAPLLQRAGLELVEDGQSWELGDRVRFSDASYQSRLWHVLRRSGRGLCRAILPLLEAHADAPDSELRAHALVALGRMGATDGFAPTLRRARVLAKSNDTVDHVLLGRYLVGVAAGGDSSALEDAIAMLRRDAEKALRSRPFLIAMREVGLKHLELAVSEIAGLAQRRTVPRLAGAGELGHKVGTVLRNQADAVGGRAEAADAAGRTRRRHKAVLSAIVAELLDDATVDVLDAAAFATTGLCFGRDTVDVCIAFLARFSSPSSFDDADSELLTATLALVFFHPAGVFSVLERFKEDVRQSDGVALETSRVCVGLTADQSGRVERFAEFLTRCFESLASLPSVITEPCQAELLSCIKGWCRDAVRSRATRDAVAELLVRLRKNPTSPLGEALTSLLKTDGDFRKPGSPLQTLAQDVLTAGARPALGARP